MTPRKLAQMFSLLGKAMANTPVSAITINP
jgi:hypothetical protein